MSKTKLFTGILLVLAVLFTQVGTAFAAPAAQETIPLTGTFQSATPETDENGVITNVVVTYTDGTGRTQTVMVSAATAEALGLVDVDELNNTMTVLAVPNVTSVSIEPQTVIPDEEEDVHPIAALLASFFEMDAGEINDMHEDGFGFGLIAQALWMAKNLDGEAVTADLILQAKRDNNFEDFTLPDGTTPKNWGQFKKAVLDKKNNLGVIVSGHADNGAPDDELTKQDKENGKGKDKNPGKGKEKDKKQ